MVLVGGKPKGRNTEQHDVLFCIGESMKDVVPQIKAFWPEAGERLHVDAWRIVSFVDGCSVQIYSKEDTAPEPTGYHLFFLNLGGYKKGEFDEFHYKMIVAAKDKSEASQKAKETVFFKHTECVGANSHVDDKYAVDVDDIEKFPDILPKELQEKYLIRIVPNPTTHSIQDKIVLGWQKLDSFT